MSSRKHTMVLEEGGLREYYDAYYRKGDFAHYPEEVDKAYFHAIFMYFGIPPNASILDGGCGTGVRLLRMQKIGKRVTGIDVSGTGLQSCRKDNPDAMLVHGDMLDMPFAGESFDGVITLGCSLVNTDNPELEQTMVNEALRVTRAGGWVIVTTVTDFSGASPSGWLYRTRKSLEDFSESVRASERRILYTAPALVARSARMALNPVSSAIVKRLPGIKRTVILGWRK